MAIAAPVIESLPVLAGEPIVGHEFIDNVYVNNKIPSQLLEGYDFNPIVDDSVQGLGRVCLEKVRVTTDRFMGFERLHRLYTLELNDFRHCAEVTHPVVDDPKFILPSFPGLTESIENPMRQALHACLADQFDNAEIVSIGTNGIGITGDKYGWNERAYHGLEAMGQQRLTLIRALGGSSLPVISMGTSMGSVVAERMAWHNIFDEPENGPINLAGQLWVTPALVDPKNILKDMAVRFIPGMFVGLAKELALKTNPREIVAITQMAIRYGLHVDDLQPLGWQILDLLHGTSEEEISNVVAKIPTLVIAGEKDSLTQTEMMNRLETAHPVTMKFSPVNGRGHELTVKSKPFCRKLAKESKDLIEQALQNSKS